MALTLEGLIKKKEFVDTAKAYFLGEIKLENINANGNPPAPLNADVNPQQEEANLNNNNNLQQILLEEAAKKMIEQMIIHNEAIKWLESDLKEKGLSLEKAIGDGSRVFVETRSLFIFVVVTLLF